MFFLRNFWKSPSQIIVLFFAISIVYVCSQRKHHLIVYDVFGYYLYLPQTFIHNDPKISNTEPVHQAISSYNSTPALYQVYQVKEGSNVIMYSMGMAILYLPFFLFGQFIAFLGDYPMDGFSPPYEFMMLIGSIFYSILGMILLRKLSLRFFDEGISTILLIVIGFGTNYYFLNIGSLAMPHLYLFALWALFLLQVDNWHKSPVYKQSLLLGLTFGLMVLVRPTEFLALLVFLLWGVGTEYSFTGKIKFLLKDNIKSVLLFAAVFFLTLLPQMIYWKSVAGSYLFNSYQNPGEGFEFLRPHLYDFLFSFRKGWFIYTPVLLFVIPGIFAMKKYNSKSFYPIVFFLIINTYVLSCWSNWWYASSFGSRPVTQSYPLLIFPLGYLFLWLREKSNYLKFFTALTLAFFVFLNLFQSRQMLLGVMNDSRMTFPYYKAIFLKEEIPEGASAMLLYDRQSALNPEILQDTSGYQEGKTILYSGFENPVEFDGGLFQKDVVFLGGYSYQINQRDAHAPPLKIPYSEFCEGEYAWIRVSMMVYPLTDIKLLDPVAYATFLNQKGLAYKWKGIGLRDIDSIVEKKWSRIEFDYLTPEPRTPNDKFSFSLYIAGEGSIVVDEFRARVYLKK